MEKFREKKISTQFSFRDHFRRVYTLVDVRIHALRMPSLCHTFDPCTSYENLVSEMEI